MLFLIEFLIAVFFLCAICLFAGYAILQRFDLAPPMSWKQQYRNDLKTLADINLESKIYALEIRRRLHKGKLVLYYLKACKEETERREKPHLYTNAIADAERVADLLIDNP